MRWPDELSGGGRAAGWFNKLLRACIYYSVRDSPDIRVVHGTHGIGLELTRTAGGGGSVNQYRLKEILGNYYRCRTWDGSTEGTDEVYIARPFTHRRGNFDPANGGPPAGVAYNSDGDSFTATFSYTSGTRRVKTVGTIAETQVIVPYFKVDFDLIYAVSVASALTFGAANTALLDPTGTPIRLLDINTEGRAWAKLETTQGN